LPENTEQESLSSENTFPAMLDVDELLASGWQPSAFRQFILKIHSRCDLACRYCYVYEMADQSWRDQPRRMSEAIVDRAAERVAEHAFTHELAEVEVILHGGEPLLAGPDLISYAVRRIRGAAADVGTRVHVGVQTNGLRLDDAYLRLFDRLEIRVGVSLDGYAEAHDRHRRFANGKGSHATLAAALRRLTAGPFHHLFSGLLCTIDVRNDPLATYEALLEIRLVREIMRLLAGSASRSEAIGLSPARMVVVETDGSIEQSDILKSSYQGAPATRLHILRDSFDVALLHPSMAARQIGELALAPVCLGCDIHSICGGGLYAHRYSTATGFSGASVYCPDLYRLIAYIRARFAKDVARLKGS
jgi:uncharacterized protein